MPKTRGTSLSVVAAIVVPDVQLESLRCEIERVTEKWVGGGQEAKGKVLNEAQLAETQEILALHDVVAVLVAIDLGTHDEDAVTRHRLEQATRLTRHLGPAHSPQVVSQVEALASRLRGLPNQLYVQLKLMALLVVDVIQTAVLHHAALHPAELVRFVWCIDAKGHELTEYEDLWRTLVAPFAQSASLRSGLIFAEGLDYSAFARFENPTLEKPPEHLRGHASRPDGPFSSFDVGKVLTEDLRFVDSASHFGVQCADIVANSFRRACHRKLKPEGWLGLGRLLIANPRSVQAIHLMQMCDETEPHAPRELPYGDVIGALERQARWCIPGDK